MTTNRVIRKQLACEEDLLYGVGTVIQVRNGVEYTLKKVITIRPVVDLTELATLDTNQFKHALVAGTPYSYNGAVWVLQVQKGDTLGFTPYGGLEATTVQGALEELEDEKLSASTTAFVTKDSVTGAAALPAGTDAQRPGTGVAGLFRFNSTINSFEGHNGTTWGPVGQGAKGAVDNPVFYENDQVVTGDYTITEDKNAMSTGPITIADTITVTVPDGSVWVIL